MTDLHSRFRRTSSPGQTMGEYALILAAVALMAVGGSRTVATRATSLFARVDSFLAVPGAVGDGDAATSTSTGEIPASNSGRADVALYAPGHPGHGSANESKANPAPTPADPLEMAAAVSGPEVCPF